MLKPLTFVLLVVELVEALLAGEAKGLLDLLVEADMLQIN